MRRIEMTWDNGQWADGIADELVDIMVQALEDAKRATPDSVRVLREANHRKDAEVSG